MIALTQTTDAIVAVVGSILVALLVRMSNMACAFLARTLGVKPPDPIQPPTPEHPLAE